MITKQISIYQVIITKDGFINTTYKTDFTEDGKAIGTLYEQKTVHISDNVTAAEDKIKNLATPANKALYPTRAELKAANII